MTESDSRWLDTILAENAKFRKNIQIDKLPVKRTPGSLAVITCMDPRVNLAAMGIPRFSEEGEGESSVRIIRTIGAMAEPRSLVIGIFLAGIREIVVIMHTDCGCCLAFSKIDTIIENLQKNLNADQWTRFRNMVAEPFRENLCLWLKAFEEPRAAIAKEIAAIKVLSFVPQNVIVHGLLYELASGKIEVVVNGYEYPAS